jgi:probable biosynthetic protein (TIGR04098 family)
MKIKLGMPHLTYNGLDPVWLSKTLGDNHWNLLRDITPFNLENQRLYASFFAFEINFNHGQHAFFENDILDVHSKIFKFNSSIYRSVHTFGVEDNSAAATFDSVFVKKDMLSGALIKDEPAVSNTKSIDTVDETFLEEHSRLKKCLSQMDVSDLKELNFTPESYFNGVKILYCANYIQLALLSEFMTYKKIPQPIKKIKGYWFKNIEWNSQVFGNTTCVNGHYETILVCKDKPIAFFTITRQDQT